MKYNKNNVMYTRKITKIKEQHYKEWLIELRSI